MFVKTFKTLFLSISPHVCQDIIPLYQPTFRGLLASFDGPETKSWRQYFYHETPEKLTPPVSLKLLLFFKHGPPRRGCSVGLYAKLSIAP
jgi:hypothetical protein